MPPHQGSIVTKFGSNPSNRLGGVAFGVYHILSHFFWLSDPDPDPKTEHNPDAPPLGEHCVQVWFKSIQTSRRSSIFSQLWTTTDGRCGMTIPHMAFGQMSFVRWHSGFFHLYIKRQFHHFYKYSLYESLLFILLIFNLPPF